MCLFSIFSIMTATFHHTDSQERPSLFWRRVIIIFTQPTLTDEPSLKVTEWLLISESSEHCRPVVDTCDLSDNWSEWWGELTRPTSRQRQRQRQRKCNIQSLLCNTVFVLFWPILRLISLSHMWHGRPRRGLGPGRQGGGVGGRWGGRRRGGDCRIVCVQ